MPDIDYQPVVAAAIEDALNYSESEFTSHREKATDYFYGEEFGNEIDGRSKVVAREVADTVGFIMPSLLRIFTTSGDYVQFIGRHQEDEAVAKQATEYCNWVLTTQNPGFRIIQNWMFDALVYRLGVVKAFWMEPEFEPTESYEGLTETQFSAIVNDPAVEVVERDDEIDQLTNELIYSVKVRQLRERGRICVENVPPEEFLFSRHARSLEDAEMVAHRRMMTVGELVSMGYDLDEVEKYAGSTDDVLDSEVTERFEDLESGPGRTSMDATRREVEVAEVYMKVDDGSGRGSSALKRFMCFGPAHEIVDEDDFDAMPFSVITPNLIAHRLVGRSVADETMDLQLIKSTVLRQILDSSYQATNPRVMAVEGQVNLDDLLQNRPGGVVRTRAPGMVQPLPVEPVHQAAFPLLGYLDEIREQRTGISKASMGLDPDALQSTTATAVAATISAAQGKVEQIARVFAETGFKDLFRSILRLAVSYQNAPQIIRLTNEFVEMDPREWDSEFDLICNVGLGNVQQDKRIAILSQIAGKQEQILQTLGPANPIVSMNQYVATLKKMVEAAGIKDANQFFRDVPPEAATAEPSEPQPDPIAQAAMAEVEIKRAEAQAEMQLKREKMEADIQLAREKLAMEMELKRVELENEARLAAIKIDNQFGEQTTNLAGIS